MRIQFLALLFALTASAQQNDPTYPRFRSILQELVETNTTLSAGDCTEAGRRMAARLQTAGYPASDLRIFLPEGHPREGGLLATLHGTDPHVKPILLLGHVDVVEAKREDWTRDPFVLVEENGYYYARGVSDMKTQDAIWVDLLIRYREEGFRPRRGITLALTCGEETNSALNGAGWLAEHERAAIDAEFALTEGEDGALDAHGRKVAFHVLAAEKMAQNYRFEVTNAGGHSSRPVPDNAIYHLARAVDKVSHYEFPVQFNDANRAYFEGMSKIVNGEQAAAMKALLADQNDTAALSVLDRNADYHAMLRTTCVATLLSAGHATNALPQRATANINCRIFPGVKREQVLHQLAAIVADPAVQITIPEVRGPEAQSAPLTDRIMQPVRSISDRMWPSIPLIPALEPGASDAQFLNPAGIPTYGITGVFTDPDGGFIHGLNERIRIQSVIEARQFLYELVKLYTEK